MCPQHPTLGSRIEEGRKSQRVACPTPLPCLLVQHHVWLLLAFAALRLKSSRRPKVKAKVVRANFQRIGSVRGAPQSGSPLLRQRTASRRTLDPLGGAPHSPSAPESEWWSARSYTPAVHPLAWPQQDR